MARVGQHIAAQTDEPGKLGICGKAHVEESIQVGDVLAGSAKHVEFQAQSPNCSGRGSTSRSQQGSPAPGQVIPLQVVGS
uniref:Uncharacterized protein n=1 Tax=Arundo donax TaxID=35708 RepID=A0A0A9AFV8_ARUDO